MAIRPDRMMIDGGMEVAPIVRGKANPPAQDAVTPPPSPVSDKPVRKAVNTYTDPSTGDVYVLYDTGERELVTRGTIQQDAAARAAADAAAKQAQGQSAYDIMYNEFAKYKLTNLIEPLKNLIVKGASPAEFTMELRKTPEYARRFPANAARIANGFAAIDEAAYLLKEDAYQQKMMQYGLPERYWKPNAIGTNDSFTQLLAGDTPVTELEDRLIAGKQVQEANAPTVQAIKQFFPEITDGEILAYVLDPKNAIKDIQRKVTIGKIGGAAMGEGLATSQQRAEELYKAGVTAEQYQKAAPFISQAAARGSELAGMYNQEVYNQATAEQEALGLAGSAKAERQRKKLTALETASFGGQSGVGALGRDRVGSQTSGAGAY